MTMNLVLPVIEDLQDSSLAQALQRRIDQKTKPLGSLGRLEQLALRLGLILGSESPRLEQPQLLVCAADHGLAARGVSAFPSEVTWQMVENFLAGGAAVSVGAPPPRRGQTGGAGGGEPAVQPAGRPAGARPGLLVRKVAAGTADCLESAAMSAQQCAEAIAHGQALVRALPGNCVLLGEMGIGNTSAASMLMARLLGRDIMQCTGAGTGLDAAGVGRKTAVLRAVLERHAQAQTPLQALAAFGGFEIATLVGVVLQAAGERRVLVVDGFITTAAVLVAQALAPHVAQRCVFAHRSGERGHAVMLDHLEAEPLLDLGLRLGEGSGAALAWPLLQSACLLLEQMASFASAGVCERAP